MERPPGGPITSILLGRIILLVQSAHKYTTGLIVLSSQYSKVLYASAIVVQSTGSAGRRHLLRITVGESRPVGSEF